MWDQMFLYPINCGSRCASKCVFAFRNSHGGRCVRVRFISMAPVQAECTIKNGSEFSTKNCCGKNVEHTFELEPNSLSVQHDFNVSFIKELSATGADIFREWFEYECLRERERTSATVIYIFPTRLPRTVIEFSTVLFEE